MQIFITENVPENPYRILARPLILWVHMLKALGSADPVFDTPSPFRGYSLVAK